MHTDGYHGFLRPSLFYSANQIGLPCQGVKRQHDMQALKTTYLHDKVQNETEEKWTSAGQCTCTRAV